MMNKQIESFARNTLKKGLARCDEHSHRIFKLMYSHKDLEKPINDVVDNIPVEKLDWAMEQVQRTLK